MCLPGNPRKTCLCAWPLSTRPPPCCAEPGGDGVPIAKLAVVSELQTHTFVFCSDAGPRLHSSLTTGPDWVRFCQWSTAGGLKSRRAEQMCLLTARSCYSSMSAQPWRLFQSLLLLATPEPASGASSEVQAPSSTGMCLKFWDASKSQAVPFSQRLGPCSVGASPRSFWAPTIPTSSVCSPSPRNGAVSCSYYFNHFCVPFLPFQFL